MEDRRLLATVNTLQDVVDAGDGLTSLREAIAAATPGETIDFAVAGTIQLSNLGQLAINKNLVIAGPGAELLTIRAFDPSPAPGNGSRVLLIDDGNAGTAKSVSLSGLTLSGGDIADSGGAIYNSENLTLTDSVVTGNRATINGGGIYDSYGSVSVVDTTISGNSAANEGGGFFKIGGQVSSLIRSTLSGNAAVNGGGLFSRLADGIHITDSTVSGNQALDDGGGIYTQETDLILQQSTVSGNQAARGGGLHVRNSDVQINSSTITNNTAASAAGIYATSGSAVFAGSIIAGNSGTNYVLQPNVADSSLGYNLVGPGSGPAPFGPNDQTGVANPMLGPLADNAGPTRTHAPLAGSPAVDRGDPGISGINNGSPVYDQRGEPLLRVYDGDGIPGPRIDVGAVELQPLPPAFYGDYNGDQHADAGDYIRWRNTLGDSVGKYSGADGNGNGVIDQNDYRHWKDNYGTNVPGGGGLATALAVLHDTATPTKTPTTTQNRPRSFHLERPATNDSPAKPSPSRRRQLHPRTSAGPRHDLLQAVMLHDRPDVRQLPASLAEPPIAADQQAGSASCTARDAVFAAWDHGGFPLKTA